MSEDGGAAIGKSIATAWPSHWSGESEPEKKPKRTPKSPKAAAKAKSTRGAGRKQARTRSTTFRDLPEIFEAILQQEQVDPNAIVEEQYRKIYYKDLCDSQFAKAIFSPDIRSLSELPPGVLDQKEELLPYDAIPQSLDELQVSCERMVIISRNHDLIAAMVGDWPAEGVGKGKLDQHVKDLWDLKSSFPVIFIALISGRHVFILKILGQNTVHGYRTFRVQDRIKIVRLVTCHSLLWCCHDVQMVLARILLSSNPAGPLVSTDKTSFPPEAGLNRLRERASLAKVLWTEVGKGSFDVTDEASSGLADRFAEADELGIGADLAASVQARAVALDVDLTKISGLQASIEQIAPAMLDPDDLIMQQAAREKTVNDESTPRIFAALWFNRLGLLDACGVTILRYVQAERCIAHLIAERVPKAGQRVKSRESVALPPFEDRLPGEIRVRAKKLLNLYRREMELDPQYQNRTEGQGTPKRAALNKVIGRSLAFLKRAGERKIGDDHGNLESIPRTFYLLDVIPEHRLSC